MTANATVSPSVLNQRTARRKRHSNSLCQRSQVLQWRWGLRKQESIDAGSSPLGLNIETPRSPLQAATRAHKTNKSWSRTYDTTEHAPKKDIVRR